MSRDTAGVLRVKTPEGVSFTFTLATPVTRFAAWAIDKVVIIIAWMIVATLLGILGVLSSDLVNALVIVALFVISIGYGIAMEWLCGGQTLGKRLLRLRVLDERGLPVEFSQIVVRNALRAVDALPLAYLLGGTIALFSRKSQRLGDVAAATIVVRVPELTSVDFNALELAKYNSLRTHQVAAARLREKTSPALAHAALQALVRRERFSPAARLELFRELAAHFRSLAPLPAELEEGISDEQFVRNVVEVVFRARPARSS